MINFTPTLKDDEPQILEWTKADPYHFRGADTSSPSWWITGSDCLVACCIDDESGPVLYFRLDKEGEFVRMHVQFAPIDQVSKRRVISSISQAMPALQVMAQQNGGKGFVFQSVSSLLIRFMGHLGFKPRPNFEDDYLLLFEEK